MILTIGGDLMKHRKNHVKKERVLKKRKLYERIVCCAIVLLMILSLQPQNLLFANITQPLDTEQGSEPKGTEEVVKDEGTQPEPSVQEQNTPKEDVGKTPEGSQPVEPTPEEPMEPKDYSSQLEVMMLQVKGIQYKQKIEEKQEQRQIDIQENQLDLSRLDLKQSSDLQMKFVIDVPTITADKPIHKGDTMKFDLPSSLFKNLTPTAVYVERETDTAGEQIGEVVVDQRNQATITFSKDLTVEEYPSLKAFFLLGMTIDEATLSSIKTVDMVLQKNETRTTSIRIILPVEKEKEPTKEPIKEPVKEESQNSEPEKEESPKEESVDPETNRNQSKEPVVSIQGKSRSLQSRIQKYSVSASAAVLQVFATNPYRQIITTGLPDGFQSVKIGIVNKTGGYDINSTDKTVGFKFDLVLDDDFLLDELERITNALPDAPIYTGDDQKYKEEMLAFLAKEETKKELTPLSYTFDLGENFRDYNSAHKDLKDSLDEKIGEYYITDGIVHVDFVSGIYFYSGVSAGFSFEAALDSDADLSDKPKDVQFDQGKLALKETGSSSGGDQPADAPKYSIDKDGPLSVDEPMITYTINLKQETDTDKLAGKWLVDLLPPGLQVKSLYQVESTKETLLNPNEYTVTSVGDKKELRYQIPENNSDKELSFKLVLELDTDAYQEVIQKGSIDSAYINQASLREESDQKDLVTSDTVQTNMKFSFLSKDGQQDALDGTKFNWTIKANTYLPSYDKGYLIDTFSYTDHTLMAGSTIKVQYKGKTDSFAVDQLKKVEADIPFGKLTVEKIEDMTTGLEPFYYIYSTTEPNPFYDKVENEPQFKQQMILILPYDSYRGVTQSEETKIQYQTQLNLHGMDIDTYLEKYNDTKDIGNIVNLLWRNKGGIGPIPVPMDQVNFSKDVNTNIEVMTKRGMSYNPLTQQTVWNLEINHLGANLTPPASHDNLIVTDEFSKGTYDESSLKISYTEYDRDDPTKKITGTLQNSDYTIEDVDGQRQLRFEVPALNSHQYRIYRLEAKLLSPETLSQQGSMSLENTAKIQANVNGKPKETITTAELNIKNTLIEKEAVGSYDYQNHLFTWKVTINPNKLNIKEAKVIDTFAIDTVFKELKSATMDGQDIKDRVTHTNTTKDNKNITTFNLGDINGQTVELEFTSELLNTDKLSKVGDDGITFPNDVELQGIVSDGDSVTHKISHATDSAVQVIKQNKIEKGGVYHPEDGSIDWTIYLNKNHVNMKDMTFVENLLSDGKSIQDLDQDSIRIYKVNMSEDGSVDDTNNIDITDAEKNNIVNVTNDGFKWQVLTENKNTIKITFTTYLNENAENATINNKVYLNDQNGAQVEESNDSDGGYDGSFSLEDMAQKSPRPKVGIHKISTNSEDENNINQDSNHALNQAEFTITAYNSAGMDTDSWILEENSQSRSKVNVTVGGKIYFLNLMVDASKNMVYELKETKAPAGYIKDETPIYIYFVKDGEQAPTNTKITVGGVQKDVKFVKYGQTDGIEEILMTNTPTTDASFSFVKKVPDTIENGAVKTYKDAGGGIKFLLTPQGNFHVKERVVESDVKGKVTFNNLDPGTYTLTEVKSPTDLDVGGSATLVVKVDDSGQYSFQLTAKTPNHGLSVNKNTSGEYEVMNDFVKGTLSFTKYVQYKDGTANQVVHENKEVLPGVKFTLTARDGSTTNTGYHAESESDTTGVVKFENIPVGTYILKEEAKDGYRANTKDYEVKVTQKTGEKLPGISSDEYKEKIADIAIQPTLSTETGKLYNEPLKGTLIFKKTIDNNNNGLNGMTILSNVEFGLFRKIKGDVAKEPIYKEMSGVDGTVTFKNVEYGDYVLRELNTPAGFEKAQDITVNRAGFKNANGSYSQELGDVSNKLLTSGVTILKVNQDGTPIPNIQFTLYRRGTASITEKSSNVALLQPEDSVKQYHAYMDKVYTTDAEGKVTLENLPLGDYLLVETNAPDDLQAGHDGIALHIKLMSDGVAEVHENDNFAQGSTPYIIDDLNGWTKKNAENNLYKVVNQKKFGYVQLHKQSGELVNQKVVRKDYSRAMSDVTFRIDRMNGTNAETYLTLKTDSSGNLPVNKDGSYTDITSGDTKHLYYGNYQIVEASQPTGYQADKTPVSFTIAEDTTGHEGIAWIQNWSDNTNLEKVVYKNSDQKLETSESAFLNGIIRNKVSLKKTGLEDKELHDAVFEVLDGQTPVASIRYEETSKGYILSDKNVLDNGKDYAQTKENVPYLFDDNGTWKLLHGTYEVKEVKIPSGYQAASFKLDISSTDGTVTLGDPVNCILKDMVIQDQPNKLILEKQNKAGDKLSNAEFRIQGNFVDGTHEKSIEDANKGQLQSDEIYTIVEKQAPHGYILASKQPQIRFNKDGKIEIEQDKGLIYLVGDKVIFTNEAIQMEVHKTNGQGASLDGAVFSLEGIFADTSGGLTASTKKENLEVHNGVVNLYGADWNLAAGQSYTLTETKAPDGYQRETASIEFQVDEAGRITPVGTWPDDYKHTDNDITLTNSAISVLFTKQGNGKALSGVEFQITPITGTYLDGTKDTITLRSDAEGGLDLSGLLKNGSTYRIHEEKALPGYSYMDDQILRIDADGKAYLNQDNNHQESFTLINEPLSFTVTKSDDDKQPAVGISFLLKEETTTKEWSLVSSEDGSLLDRDGNKLSQILHADSRYTLVEQPAADSPYKNLYGEVSFTLTRAGHIENVTYDARDTVTYDDTSLQIVNQKTKVSFEKQDESGKAVKDATLALYQDQNGSPAKEIMKIDDKDLTWKSDGSAYSIEKLPQGVYWLKEISTPSGYITANPIQFELEDTGTVKLLNQEGQVKDHTIIMKDQAVAGHFRIEKQGTQGMALSGVKFKLYHEDGTLIHDDVVTDQNGVWTSEGKDITRKDDETKNLRDGLETGTYYVEEVQTLDGYQLPQGEQAKTTFTIEGKDRDNTVVQPDTKSVKIQNTAYERILTIRKQDNVDSSAIAGTAFSLVRIKDQDGKEVQEEGITKYSDAQGNLNFTVQKKGTYVVKEVMASHGYVLGEKPYRSELVVKDTSPMELVLEGGNTIQNQRATGRVTITKADDASKEALNDAVFTLEKGDSNLGDFITGYRYHKDKDGTWVKESTTEGTLEIHDLEWGTYTIKESRAPEGYQLQNNTKDFTIGKQGTEMILEVNTIGFTNLQTEVSFTKLARYVESCSDETLGDDVLSSDTTRPLSQAEFTAYDDEGKVFARAVSDENGNVKFHKMRAGSTYTIKETKTPVGFAENNHTYTVKIAEDGQAESIIDTTKNQSVTEVINDIIRTDIVLHKVSEQNPDKGISGSLYGLYRVPKFRSAAIPMQLIATARTNKDGEIRFAGVLMNQEYVIKELEAPEGSHLSAQPITIRFVHKDGKITMTKFEDGEGTAKVDEEGNIVWYEPDVMVNFTKTDQNGTALKGASLELLDDSGNVIDHWITKEEAHKTMNLLTAGKQYTLREVEAPYGYALAAPITFKVTEKAMGPGMNYVEEIIMKDSIINLTVEKKDKATGKLLAGVEFEIYEADSGKLAVDKDDQICAWTSSGKDTLSGIGYGDYVLREVKPASGYDKGEDLPFTITENGELYVDGQKVESLVMYNEKTPVKENTPQENNANKGETQKPNGEKQEQKREPDTGDSTDQSVYILLLSISLLSLFCVSNKLYKLRKK